MTFLFRTANGRELRLTMSPDTSIDEATDIVAHELHLPATSNVVLYCHSYRLSPRWELGDLEADEDTPIYVRVRQGGCSPAIAPPRSESAVPHDFLQLLQHLGLSGQYPESLILKALDQAHGNPNSALTLLMDSAVRPTPVLMPPPSPDPQRKKDPWRDADPLDSLLAEFSIDPSLVRDIYEESGRNTEIARDLLRQMCG
jgi:hypothetical protein